PSEARRASPALRARRFVERHPAGSIALALGTLLVVGGPLVYASQERRRRLDLEEANERVQAANAELELALGQVSHERDEARRQFERAEGNLEAALGAVDVLLARVADRTLRQVPHMDQVRRGLFVDALAFYEDLLAQRAESTTSIDEFEVRLKLGQLEFEFGEYSAAEQRLQVLLDELEDFERSGAGEGDDVLYLRGRALNTLGTLHSFPRLTPQGLEEMREAARILEECATGDSATSTRRATAALAMSNLGMRLWQMERPREEVLDVYERSRALRLATDRNDVRTLLELCDIDAIRARCLSELGRLPEARAAADDASAVLDSALALRPAERGARRRLVEVAVRLAFVFDGQGALEDGVALLSAARPVSEGLLRDFPEDVQVLQQSLMLDTNLAGMLTGLQRDAEAEVLLRQLIERCATQGTAAAAEDGVAQVAASARTNLSAILVQRGEFDAARTEVDAAVASYERLVQSGVQGTMRTALIRNLGGSMVARAKVNLASRALDEAGAELEAAEKHLAGHSRGEFDLAHAWMLLFAALEADPSLTRSDPLEVLDQAGRRALAALQRAVDLGWADAAHLREHAEWQPLHGTAELDALLQRLDAGLR
ncbi:MAG TPA: hypothetical protein VMT18_14565, partial [Planctomycetota bacterium]|nr:hypothetical protein [Planctomycetota bacterium]